jgi:hypothetical protein
VEGLDRGARVANGALGLGVLSLHPLGEEGRQRDRGQEPDDQDHDQELDQREAALILESAR